MAQQKRNMHLTVFSSFEEENAAEYKRRANMTPKQRLAEFATLQARLWGRKWTHEPMIKVAGWEKVDW